MTRLLVGLITLYQYTLSPDHGFGRLLMPSAGCKFAPTCSTYTKDAILQYGAWKGVYMGMRRISRCHPWSRGGWDPVT